MMSREGVCIFLFISLFSAKMEAIITYLYVGDIGSSLAETGPLLHPIYKNQLNRD